LWSVVAWYRYPVVYVEPRALLAQHRPSSDDETGLEWLMLVLSAYGKSRAIGQRVAPEVLELVGLGNKYDVPVRHLSGGEKQRLALATSIVNRPGVLLLDGPFDGLDPDTSVEIMRFLDRLNRAGTAVLCATHDDYIVNITRRRVIEQERGRIVRDQPHATYR
jgi:cell division transport system ATP-binding protein